MTRNILNIFYLGRSRLTVRKEIDFFKEKFSQLSLSLSKAGRRLEGYLILNLYLRFFKDFFKRYLKDFETILFNKAKKLIYRER